MWLLAANFTDKILDYREYWSDAADDCLIVIILSVTLEGTSRGSNSFKRRHIS